MAPAQKKDCAQGLFKNKKKEKGKKFPFF